VRVQSVVPPLPRAAWLLLAADAVSAIGSGMTAPYLMVYLHVTRGFGVGTAAGVVACVGLVSLAGNPLGGALADRWAARPTVMLGLAVAALGCVGWGLALRPWQAFAAAATFGLGVSVAVPAQGALLAALAGPGRRSDACAVGHLTMNAGLGAGALVASIMVAHPTPGAFSVLYLVDAASFGVAVLVVAAVRHPAQTSARRGTPTPHTMSTGTPRRQGDVGGYRRVLRDPVFRRLWLLAAVLFTVAFGQLAAFPLLAVEHAGIGLPAVSLLFAANTVTVVACQLVTLRLLAGRRRSRAVLLLCALWAACWVLAFAGCLAGGGAAALALFAGVAVVFALGETLLAPTVPAIVNDIAPEPLRGRYNGGYSLALTVGCVAGPLLAGLALGHGRAGPLLLGLLAACAVAAALMRRTEPLLPAPVNLVPSPVPASATAGAATEPAGRAA
jgi:MFS family permease